MPVVDWATKLATLVWRQHYRIPRGAYWIISTVAALTLPLAMYWERPWSWAPSAFFLILGCIGLVRWGFESTPPAALIVPRFYAREELRTRAEEVQRLTLKTLRDHLGESLPRKVVRAIPLVLGPEEDHLAAAVKRRLHALYLVYGEIRSTSDGELHIIPKLLITQDRVHHLDPHTKELIPHRTGLKILLRSLSPAPGIGEEEYPFAFAFELEALVRGLLGEIEMTLGRHAEAEQAFRDALAVASSDSESPALDHLYVRLAQSVYQQDREEEALEQLRRRAVQARASAELLFGLASLLGDHNTPTPFRDRSVDPAANEEIEALLRRVVQDRTFRARDQAMYNLANVLANSDDESKRSEGFRMLEEVHKTSPYYSRAWYVKLALGGYHWFEAQRHREAGNKTDFRRHIVSAAAFYSQAIRSRPRFQIRKARYLARLARFRKSAILYANAHDAHRESGHRARAWAFDRTTNRLRKRHLRRGEKALRRRDVLRSYEDFDWALVGRQDAMEVAALVGRAIALAMMERAAEAKNALDRASSIDPRDAEQRLSYFAERCSLGSEVSGLRDYIPWRRQ